MSVPLSVYMLTFNNADTVEVALKSVAFADEIVVVDSGSTDGTLEILKRYTDRVYHQDWLGFRDQYQKAADYCQHDWALFIDADEEVGPALQSEIRETLAANTALPEAEQVKGYEGPRRTFFLDRWVLHGAWASDREIRLYDRRAGSWKGGLHAKIHVDGSVVRLHHYYYHYTYRDISDQLATLDKYSSVAAEDMHEDGKRFAWLRLLTGPPFRFLRDYLLKGGFRDGFAGLVIAVNTMFYVFNKHAKLWERERLTAEKIAARQAEKPESQ